jgi:RNA polymerase sigma-70 factor (ECF subfamily)
LTLLDRLRQKQVDQEAWDVFVRVYGPLIFGRCIRQGLQPADAEDVTQEVFRKVLASIGQFERRHTQAFRGWLARIAVNAAADLHRRRQGAPEAAGGSSVREKLEERPGPTAGPAEEEAFSAAEVRRRVVELLRAKFGGQERTWQAFYRQAVDGLPAADVAEELGMTVGAVAVAKSRVFKQLREACSGLLGEEGS